MLNLALTTALTLITLMVTVSSNHNPTNPTNPTTKYRCEFVNLNCIYFFSHRVINRWNALHGETVSSSSINAFKNKLNKITMTRMGYFME